MDKTSSFQNSPDNLPQDKRPVNDQAQGAKAQLVKAAGVMGGMTLLSRILGMARDVISAKAFGTSWQWDGFLYAFMLPNFFRRVLGEGALSSAFIPVYSETLSHKGPKEAFQFANLMLTVIVMGFAAFLLVAEVILALVLRAQILPERLAYIVDLLRFFFPYLAIMSVYALWMGLLNAHRRFFAAACGPVILNVIWIGGTLWVMHFTPGGQTSQLRTLALIIFFAGFVQLLFEWPSLARLGYKPAWIFKRAHAGLLKTGALFFPVTLGFAVMQINLLVSMTLSFWIGPGANSTLWYGNRLMQLPLGLFAVGMGTALLPSLARHLAAKDMLAAEKDVSFSLRVIFLFVLPCSVGLMALSAPIVQLLFERGEFGPEATKRTASALFFFAAGLLAHAGQKIITTGFHASQNTKSPVKIAVFVLVLNMILNFALMKGMRESGLALATSISGFVQFGMLIAVFHRTLIKLPLKNIFVSFIKTGAASVGMGFFASGCYQFLLKYFPDAGVFDQITRLGATIFLSAGFYILLCFLLRIEEVYATTAFLRSKIFRRKAVEGNNV